MCLITQHNLNFCKTPCLAKKRHQQKRKSLKKHMFFVLDSVAEKDVIRRLSVSVPRYPHRPKFQNIYRLFTFSHQLYAFYNHKRLETNGAKRKCFAQGGLPCSRREPPARLASTLASARGLAFARLRFPQPPPLL